MASKAIATAAFLLSLNILFFTLVSSASAPCPPPPKPKNPPKGNKPSPSPPPPPPPASCPRDALKLKVCANVLNLINISLPPTDKCCPLINGLADLEAALCLCTAIKANVLGINLNIPISLSLILNHCGKDIPKGFQCPN